MRLFVFEIETNGRLEFLIDTQAALQRSNSCIFYDGQKTKRGL